MRNQIFLFDGLKSQPIELNQSDNPIIRKLSMQIKHECMFLTVYISPSTLHKLLESPMLRM